MSSSRPPDSPISYDSIQRELHPAPLTVLCGIDNQTSSAITRGEMTEMDGLKLSAARGLGLRSQEHVLRLLQRQSSAELAFGRAFCHFNVGTLLEEKAPTTRAIRNVVEGEVTDAHLFWTFAPYIYARLCTELAPAVAMRLVLNWARNGASLGGGRLTDWGRVHLSGLEFLNDQEVFHPFGLHPQVDHVSHAYVAQEAIRIAESLLAEGPSEHSELVAPEEVRTVGGHVRAILRDAEAIGTYSDVEVLDMLRSNLAQRGQSEWHLPAILNEHFEVYSGFRAQADVLKGNGTGKEGPARSAAVLSSMLEWREQHEEAVRAGFRAYGAQELEVATRGHASHERRIEACYPLTGQHLADGRRWTSGDGRTLNISRGGENWAEPLVQLKNHQGWREPTGWLFKIA